MAWFLFAITRHFQSGLAADHFIHKFQTVLTPCSRVFQPRSCTIDVPRDIPIVLPSHKAGSVWVPSTRRILKMWPDETMETGVCMLMFCMLMAYVQASFDKIQWPAGFGSYVRNVSILVQILVRNIVHFMCKPGISTAIDAIILIHFLTLKYEYKHIVYTGLFTFSKCNCVLYGQASQTESLRVKWRNCNDRG